MDKFALLIAKFDVLTPIQFSQYHKEILNEA